MTTDESIISYAVKVNSGSGVLVSALSPAFSYVLTAHHVIGDPIVVNRNGQELNIIGVPYRHPDYDCSIIKVEYQPDISQHIWRGELDAGSRISYVGYPRSNVGSDRPYKIYTGTSNDQAHQLIVCNLDNSPSQEFIEGMSGGGVYCFRGGHPFLWGIEARMDDEDADARYGRIRCHSMECFDQIIEANQLAKMAPFYMRCFSNLKSDIFHFNAANPGNVEKLRLKLGQLAEWLIEQNMPAPHDLMVRYKRELLLGDKEPDSTVLDRDLWVAYLEFAVVCSILDAVDVIDETYLESLDRRRRFMYSCSDDNWLWKLSDLIKSAREMLDANGAILVNSPQENAADLPGAEDIQDVLDDIASSPNFRAMTRIDSAHGDIVKTYSFAHLKGLRNKLVLDNHREYGRSSSGQQLAIFKEYYDRAIKEGS
ncbi:ABC-three component system protein [Pseudomonas syringae group sp. J309-1]|uniref:ABC-three component system protein n=1 Tax=Pseudomonas syringae group sp. J309-1 TaxID=3079588 RepID=UPI002906209A|nr:ABC-three component system protein [Pseudomonas syringae group sp. J309-1]MDU8357938.1 ABC-three component system protein [Pseudomonas syringae group sp. J309-1]